MTITFDSSGVLGMIIPVDGPPTSSGATISSPVGVQDDMLVASNVTLTESERPKAKSSPWGTPSRLTRGETGGLPWTGRHGPDGPKWH